MMKLETQKLFLVTMICLPFLGCGSATDSDKIGDAQLCLNKASTLGQVNTCLTAIADLNSPSADAVRCNGNLISEGFASPTKYINALDQMNGGGGTVSFMSLITFTAGNNYATDASRAYSAFNYCLNSGAKGSTLIVSFGYMAMGMYKYMAENGGTCATTPGTTGYDLSTCMTSFALGAGVPEIKAMICPTTTDADGAAFQTSFGSVLASTYNLSCSGSNANASLCSTLATTVNAAGGVSNTRALTSKFLETLSGGALNTAVCP